MLHDEDYGSDSSDDDYIPTEGKDSDDFSSGAEGPNSDIGADSSDEVEPSSKKIKVKKNTKNKKSNSRSKGNPLLLKLQQDNVDKPPPSEVEDPQNQSETEKKKDDDIWADFLADTEEKKDLAVVKPKKLSWSELLGTKIKKSNVSTSSLTQVDAPPTTAAPSNVFNLSSVTKSDKEKPTTVKITKIFDFAGEEVRVEEEVAADSKEAQSAAAQQRLAQSSPTPGAPFKRSSNLAGLVNSLAGKRQKLSTLEKTKLDWQSFKKEEGLTDELLLHTKSKDTYLDKQEFLQRADLRQFELEREVRLAGRRALK